MRQNRLAFLLACAGLLCAMAGAPAIGTASAPEAFDGAPFLQGDVAPGTPDACPPLPPTTGDQFTPVACRMAPECSTNDDCVAFCGPSGGHCVHSRCPIRICKCN